ncbi:hypothetical protein [Haloferula rosea]|uniref:Uncharacterized protein n=1 Tax=Haloferula rosea TaxID=490093 RepID=A0A934RCN5_9BACT|nr:hypothetical protein [Haloferula rosea]MBK1828712.1 hypothetical protein [Haloferula rosea]
MRHSADNVTGMSFFTADIDGGGFDPLAALEYGGIGLAAVCAYLAYTLLKDVGEEERNRQKLIERFMIFALIIAVLGSTAKIIELSIGDGSKPVKGRVSALLHKPGKLEEIKVSHRSVGNEAVELAFSETDGFCNTELADGHVITIQDSGLLAALKYSLQQVEKERKELQDRINRLEQRQNPNETPGDHESERGILDAGI